MLGRSAGYSRLHCAARSRGPSPNSLRSLRSTTFKQAATSQSTNALRAGPQALRCSSPQKSPPPGTARRECNRCWSFPQIQENGAAKVRSGRSEGASEAARSTGLVARARSTHQKLTCRRLFERSAAKQAERVRRRATRPSTAAQSAVPGRPPQRSPPACPNAPLLSQTRAVGAGHMTSHVIAKPLDPPDTGAHTNPPSTKGSP